MTPGRRQGRMGLLLSVTAACAILTAPIRGARAGGGDGRFSLSPFDGIQETSGPEQAQEPPPPGDDAVPEAPPPPIPTPAPGERRITNEVSFGLFVGGVNGLAVDSEGIPGLSSDLDYDDLWESGRGFFLHWRLHIGFQSPGGKRSSWGPGFFVDISTFDGKSERADFNEDGLQDRLEPEELSFRKFLLGAHVRYVLADFHFSTHFGVGPVHIPAVEADLVTAEITPKRITLYDETIAAGFSVGVRAGWFWEMSPSLRLGFLAFIHVGGTTAPRDRSGEHIAPGAEESTTHALGLAVSLEIGTLPHTIP